MNYYKRKKDKSITFWTYEALIEDAKKWWEKKSDDPKHNLHGEPFEQTKLIEYAIGELIKKK